MFLESGPAIRRQIQKLIDETRDEPMRIAVAYWGAGVGLALPRQACIICDLLSGACNPDAIRQLMAQPQLEVRTYDDFHAKVVLGDTGAIVSSANLSINGIGREGESMSGTQEAGVLLAAGDDGYRDICAWFDQRWNLARRVTPELLALADKLWRARSAVRLPLELGAMEPWLLLRRTFVKNHRVRRVREEVFARLSAALPGVDPTRAGKIAAWACHLLLNRINQPLDYAATDAEPGGEASDRWIAGRFGNDPDGKTARYVQDVLRAIRDDIWFDERVRVVAAVTLRVQPWVLASATRS